MEQQFQQGLSGWRCLSAQGAAPGTNKPHEFGSKHQSVSVLGAGAPLKEGRQPRNDAVGHTVLARNDDGPVKH